MDTLHLANYPLERVQEWLHAGVITDDQWEGYAHAWRTGAPRFSSELAAYTLHEFTTEGAREAAETLGCCKWAVPGSPAYEAAGKDAGLGVGHIWTAVQCPAYRTLNGADCTCSGRGEADTRETS